MREGTRLSPMMTAASPTTMTPTPMVTSALPWLWAKRAPARPTRLLESAMPARTAPPVETPWAAAMAGLAPLARSDSPYSEPRNQAMTARAASAMSPKKIATLSP